MPPIDQCHQSTSATNPTSAGLSAPPEAQRRAPVGAVGRNAKEICAKYRRRFGEHSGQIQREAEAGDFQWKVEDAQVMFFSNADVEQFNSYLSGLQAAAQRQQDIQLASQRKMQEGLRQLE